jgi:hypothetical protein
MREPRRCFRVGRPRVTRTPSRVQTTTRSNRRPVLLVSRAKAFQLAFTVFEKACFSTPFCTPFQKPSLRGRPPGNSREAAVTWRERMGQVYSRQSWRGGCVKPPSFARRVRHGEQTDAASVSHRPCAWQTRIHTTCVRGAGVHRRAQSDLTTTPFVGGHVHCSSCRNQGGCAPVHPWAMALVF